MQKKATATALAALSLLGATLLTGAPAATASARPALQQVDGPTDQQVMDAFSDEWGQTTFEPTGITDWVTDSTWERAAQYAFAPGTDETTGTPTEETGLAPLRLDVVSRQAHGQPEYQVRETAGKPDGTRILNYFPIFSGTPQAMTYYNAAGIPGLPAGEIQQTCRDMTGYDRPYLACRMIASDGSIHYQIKTESGAPTTGLPALSAVMNAFRDQWGTTTFTPSGATPWEPVSQWSRFHQFTFPEGTNELDGTPVDDGDATLRPFTVWMMSRTVNGERQFVERSTVTLEDGTDRNDGFEFDRFRGTGTDWFHYTAPTVGVPFPGAEDQLHRKVVTIDGKQLLVVRVTFPPVDDRADISYYVMSPVA